MQKLIGGAIHDTPSILGFYRHFNPTFRCLIYFAKILIIILQTIYITFYKINFILFPKIQTTFYTAWTNILIQSTLRLIRLNNSNLQY